MEIPKKVTKKTGFLFGREPECTLYFWKCDCCGAKHSSFKPHWIEGKDGSLKCDDGCQAFGDHS